MEPGRTARVAPSPSASSPLLRSAMKPSGSNARAAPNYGAAIAAAPVVNGVIDIWGGEGREARTSRMMTPSGNLPPRTPMRQPLPPTSPPPSTRRPGSAARVAPAPPDDGAEGSSESQPPRRGARDGQGEAEGGVQGGSAPRSAGPGLGARLASSAGGILGSLSRTLRSAANAIPTGNGRKRRGGGDEDEDEEFDDDDDEEEEEEEERGGRGIGLRGSRPPSSARASMRARMERLLDEEEAALKAASKEKSWRSSAGLLADALGASGGARRGAPRTGRREAEEDDWGREQERHRPGSGRVGGHIASSGKRGGGGGGGGGVGVRGREEEGEEWEQARSGRGMGESLFPRHPPTPSASRRGEEHETPSSPPPPPTLASPSWGSSEPPPPSYAMYPTVVGGGASGAPEIRISARKKGADDAREADWDGRGSPHHHAPHSYTGDARGFGGGGRSSGGSKPQPWRQEEGEVGHTPSRQRPPMSTPATSSVALGERTPTLPSLRTSPLSSRAHPAAALGGVDLDTSDGYSPTACWSRVCSACAGAGADTVPELLTVTVRAGHLKCLRVVFGMHATALDVVPTAAVVRRAAVLTGLRDPTRRVVLHTAAECGYADCVALLLEVGADPLVIDAEMRTPLHAAAAGGADEAAALLLDCAYESLAMPDKTGCTPLHLCAAGGSEVVTRMLLESAADPRCVDAGGATPLHVARSGGVATALLECGADARVVDAQGFFPVHCAAAAPDVEVLLTLLELPTPTSGVDDQHARTTTLPASARKRKGGSPRRLPQEGVPQLSLRGLVCGRTPLHVSAECGHMDAVTTLALHGADLCVIDGAGRTPHACAVWRGHTEVAAFLAAAEAKFRAAAAAATTAAPASHTATSLASSAGEAPPDLPELATAAHTEREEEDARRAAAEEEEEADAARLAAEHAEAEEAAEAAAAAMASEEDARAAVAASTATAFVGEEAWMAMPPEDTREGGVEGDPRREAWAALEGGGSECVITSPSSSIPVMAITIMTSPPPPHTGDVVTGFALPHRPLEGTSPSGSLRTHFLDAAEEAEALAASATVAAAKPVGGGGGDSFLSDAALEALDNETSRAAAQAASERERAIDAAHRAHAARVKRGDAGRGGVDSMDSTLAFGGAHAADSLVANLKSFSAHMAASPWSVGGGIVTSPASVDADAASKYTLESPTAGGRGLQLALEADLAIISPPRQRGDINALLPIAAAAGGHVGMMLASPHAPRTPSLDFSALGGFGPAADVAYASTGLSTGSPSSSTPTHTSSSVKRSPSFLETVERSTALGNEAAKHVEAGGAAVSLLSPARSRVSSAAAMRQPPTATAASSLQPLLSPSSAVVGHRPASAARTSHHLGVAPGSSRPGSAGSHASELSHMQQWSSPTPSAQQRHLTAPLRGLFGTGEAAVAASAATAIATASLARPPSPMRTTPMPPNGVSNFPPPPREPPSPALVSAGGRVRSQLGSVGASLAVTNTGASLVTGATVAGIAAQGSAATLVTTHEGSNEATVPQRPPTPLGRATVEVLQRGPGPAPLRVSIPLSAITGGSTIAFQGDESCGTYGPKQALSYSDPTPRVPAQPVWGTPLVVEENEGKWEGAEGGGGSPTALQLRPSTSHSHRPDSRSALDEVPSASIHRRHRGAGGDSGTSAPTPKTKNALAAAISAQAAHGGGGGGGTPASLLLAPSGGLILAAPRPHWSSEEGEAEVDEEPDRAWGEGDAPIAGWARPPRVVPRRPVTDYEQLVDAFVLAGPYAAAARGGPRMPCVLCGSGTATRAFLPCAHACVCDACMKANDVGPMRPLKALTPSAAPGGGGRSMKKGGSGHLSWDVCPLCVSTVLAVVPCGTVDEPSVRARVEGIMVGVEGSDAQAAAAAGAAGSPGGAGGTVGPGFGGAHGPLSSQFRAAFARSAKALSAYAAAAARGQRPAGSATLSDLARAGWDERGEAPWVAAADYSGWE